MMDTSLMIIQKYAKDVNKIASFVRMLLIVKLVIRTKTIMQLMETVFIVTKLKMSLWLRKIVNSVN